jgi:AcrR family transcriptional regulator
MDLRARILDAAARVFAETGYRGATTRRIAQEAGVNEVTLFRQFGSKDELLREAVECAGHQAVMMELPAEPRDPEAELTAWARSHHAHLCAIRSFLRTCLGESEEHGDLSKVASQRPRRVYSELRAYLERLRLAGLAAPDFDTAAAAAMLMGAVFTDAMTRDIMPDMHPYSAEEAPDRYVRLLMQTLGSTGASR